MVPSVVPFVTKLATKKGTRCQRNQFLVFDRPSTSVHSDGRPANVSSQTTYLGSFRLVLMATRLYK